MIERLPRHHRLLVGCNTPLEAGILLRLHGLTQSVQAPEQAIAHSIVDPLGARPQAEQSTFPLSECAPATGG